MANPVDASEDLNRLDATARSNLIDSLVVLMDVATRSGKSGDRAAAAETWAEVFGQFFPMPEDNYEEQVAKAEGTRGAISLYRFDPQIEVEATPRSNANRTWNGLNELQPIPKDCEIRFRLANAAQLPQGATLRWTVRNRGDEAASLNDLGHLSGGAMEITERSAYLGDHAMDLTVYLGLQVFGRRRVVIKVRGNAMPARHRPPRRLFGRR